MSAAELAAFTEPLRAFVEDRHLDGRATLPDDAPLLEWGILDSLALADLMAFVEERFALQVPVDAITPSNFRDLRSIAALL
ncbi:MAG TPA: acyl carrier protein, partial [Solirubrobacterales bacterium]|nr:acyl carrier protein [Solirubrobacterales bacterium]